MRLLVVRKIRGTEQNWFDHLEVGSYFAALQASVVLRSSGSRVSKSHGRSPGPKLAAESLFSDIRFSILDPHRTEHHGAAGMSM
jgi:hypothetical protein